MIIEQRAFPAREVERDADEPAPAFQACPAALASDPIVRRTLIGLRRTADGYAPAAERSVAELQALDIVARETHGLRAFQSKRAIEEAKLAGGQP